MVKELSEKNLHKLVSVPSDLMATEMLYVPTWSKNPANNKLSFPIKIDGRTFATLSDLMAYNQACNCRADLASASQTIDTMPKWLKS